MDSSNKRTLQNRIYQWVLSLLKFTNTLPRDTATQIIVRQVIRSGTSVGANYIEGQAASSRKDFVNFLHHSLKSANESLYWLMLIQDLHTVKSRTASELLQEISEITKILGASIRTAKARRER